MKKITQTLKNNKWKIVIGIFIIFTGLFGNFYIFKYGINHELEAIKIDKYNFDQLEKAKPFLNQIAGEKIKIYALKDFNKAFNSDIQPVKNCYDVSYNNGKYPYIFAFQLESQLNKLLYRTTNYSYPGYDIPIHYQCFGGYFPNHIKNGEDLDGCRDSNLYWFKKIISNPCE